MQGLGLLYVIVSSFSLPFLTRFFHSLFPFLPSILSLSSFHPPSLGSLLLMPPVTAVCCVLEGGRVHCVLGVDCVCVYAYSWTLVETRLWSSSVVGEAGHGEW